MVDPSLLSRVQARLQQQVVAPFEHRVRAPLRRLRNAARTYRPIFVSGASGSGTSLLAVALGQRFQCAGLVYECDAQISRRSFLHVPALSTFRTVADYQRFIEPRDDWSVEEGRRDVLDMLRAYAADEGDGVVAKGPDIHLLRAEFLHRCFPDASFAVIFRDPVANVEGLRRKWSTFGDDRLDETIRFYREIHEHFLRAAERFPERVCFVEYERLVERAEATLDELGARLGLAPARRLRRLPLIPNVEGKGVRNVQGQRIGMVADANDRSRARLEPRAAQAIEAALGPLHERLRAAAAVAPTR
jgi:Sulfotransferase family